MNITSNLRKNREAAVVQSEGETEAAAKQAGGRSSSDDRGGCSASFTSILDPPSRVPDSNNVSLHVALHATVAGDGNAFGKAG